MKKTLIISALLIMLIGINSCETDVDIIADYEEITIVYGLLSIDDTTTYLRINKAFLGDGNALIMAKVPDSSNFSYQLDVSIDEYEGNEIKETHHFVIDTIHNKKPGIFYNEYQILYKDDFVINDDNTYKLRIVTHDTVITAETEIVHNFSITRPSFGSTYFKFLPGISPNFKWVTAENGKRYEAKIIFTYKEKEFNSQNIIKRSIVWDLGTKKSTSLSSGNDMEYALSSDYFFDLISNNVPYSDVQKESNVEYRICDSLEFIVTAGGEALNTYLEVNEPSYSIVQDKPEYTNITNGIGIFSSRKDRIRQKLVHPETVMELVGMNMKFVAAPPTK